MSALAAYIDLAAVGEDERVVASQRHLFHPCLLSRPEVLFLAYRVVKCHFPWARCVFLGAGSQLPVVTLPEGEELLVSGQHHGVIVPTGNFTYFFAFEELYEFWMRQILFVCVSELSLVLVLPTTAPGVDLSLRVEGDAVEISAGDVCDYLSRESFDAYDSTAFVTSFFPEAAAPGEEGALVGECEGVVVSTGYFLDSVEFAHLFVEVELTEVVDLSDDADLAEEERTGHVDFSIGVDDGGVGAYGGDFFDYTSESADGVGEIGHFVGGDGELSVLVASPGVD